MSKSTPILERWATDGEFALIPDGDDVEIPDIPLISDKVKLGGAEEAALEAEGEHQEAAGNPYHDKGGRFTTAGGLKGKPVTKAATVADKVAAARAKAIDRMSAEDFTRALRAVTGRHDYTAVARGGYKQIEKETGPLSVSFVRAKTWSEALVLATKKWGLKK